MRIISQDGMNDYPYDYIVVYVNHLEHNKIGATTCGDSYDIELGEYNSEEDALCVMKSIRKAAMDRNYYFYMPSAEGASWWRQKAAEGGEL